MGGAPSEKIDVCKSVLRIKYMRFLIGFVETIAKKTNALRREGYYAIQCN